MFRHLFHRKPLHVLHEEMRSDNRLRRVLGPWSLTSLGVGCVIGAGIFVVTGAAAHSIAGPALVVSFVVAGLACIFSALCYAELASMVPVAGSAYTYAYATLGELLAWIIGWDLILEYTVASASVAHAWSKYFQNFIGILGFKVPGVLSNSPFDYKEASGAALATANWFHRFVSGNFEATGSWFDLPALVIVAALTVVLVIGIRESSRVNNTMVAIKVGIVLLVIVAGAFYVHPANWHPFAPFGWGGLSLFGKNVWGPVSATGKPAGMLAGAAMIFFAYIGFDSVSTHAEEARNPQRDVPFGIITSLVLCTVLYIAVTIVLTGMVPYDQLNEDAAVAQAFEAVHLGWCQFVVSLGAVVGITSVMLVLMLSQPRVLLAMARDGLLPIGFFGAVHPRFRTPWKATILTGGLVASMAALLPLDVLLALVNVGTLFAFVIVCAAVIVLRYLHPQSERPFRCPWVPVVPVLGIFFCLTLMFSLPPANWLRLLVWMLIGMCIYFGYGRHRSTLARMRSEQAAD